MKYTEWQLLNEAIGMDLPLGLTTPHTVGGPVGARLAEAPMNFKRLKDKDEDDDDEDLEDEDGEEKEPEDLLGGDEEDMGPEKSFPPDSGEEMDGLPTPDEEMLDGDDEMDDTLAGIDPDLAGLGDDDMPPELGDEMGGDELGGEDDLAALIDGDEMGELGDEMGPTEPCPDCNPDGEMEEGDPDCETCAGEGFMPPMDDEMLPGDIDAEVEGGMEDKMEPEGPEVEMMDLMSRMASYCAKYMNPMMSSMMRRENIEVNEIAPAVAAAVAAGVGGYMAQRKNNSHDNCKKKCCKGCKVENTQDDFLRTLNDQAKGDVHQKWSSGFKEDALIKPQETEHEVEVEEPQAGDVGFAPQGKVGAIGGGYTMADFKDIPILGESTNYSTWKGYLAKKAKK